MTRCAATASVLGVVESYMRAGRLGEALTVLRGVRVELDPALKDCDPFKLRRSMLAAEIDE